MVAIGSILRLWRKDTRATSFTSGRKSIMGPGEPCEVIVEKPDRHCFPLCLPSQTTMRGAGRPLIDGIAAASSQDSLYNLGILMLLPLQLSAETAPYLSRLRDGTTSAGRSVPAGGNTGRGYRTCYSFPRRKVRRKLADNLFVPAPIQKTARNMSMPNPALLR